MSVDIVGWEIYRTTNLPVVGAAVNLRGATVSQPSSAGIITNQNTDSNGRYSFTGLADGDYDIDITYAGVTKSYKGLTKFNGIVQPGNFQPVTQGLVFASPPSSTGRPSFRQPGLSDFGSGFGPNLVVGTPNGAVGPLVFRNVVGADFGLASPNGVFAGPPSGGAVAPTFRSLVGGDFGALAANLVLASPPSGGAAVPTFRNVVGADFGTGVGSASVFAGPGTGSPGAPGFRGMNYSDVPPIHQIASVLGSTSNPASSATGATLIPEMTLGLGPIPGVDVFLWAWVGYQHDTLGAQVRFYVSRDGNDIIVGTPHVVTANYQSFFWFVYRYASGAGGLQTYQLKFSVTAGTITFTGTYRGLFLMEIRR